MASSIIASEQTNPSVPSGKEDEPGCVAMECMEDGSALLSRRACTHKKTSTHGPYNRSMSSRHILGSMRDLRGPSREEFEQPSIRCASWTPGWNASRDGSLVGTGQNRISKSKRPSLLITSSPFPPNFPSLRHPFLGGYSLCWSNAAFRRKTPSGHHAPKMPS